MDWLRVAGSVSLAIAALACNATERNFGTTGGGGIGSITSGATGSGAAGGGGASASSGSAMPECTVDADCPKTATDCVVPKCTAGQCGTMLAADRAPCANSGGQLCS